MSDNNDKENEMYYYDRRVTNYLVNYWNNLRGARAFPDEPEIDPDELKEVWESCFLVQVNDIKKGHEYNYTYFGKALQEAYCKNLTGLSVESLVSPQASHLHAEYEKVVNTKEPIIDESVFINKNNHLIKYRQCLLPLGHDNNTVTFILGGMRYLASIK